MSFHEGSPCIEWSYTKSMDQPKILEVGGVDTGITDLFYASDGFYVSDGNGYSSLHSVIDFYKKDVGPAFIELLYLWNKKGNIQYYLHKHLGLSQKMGKCR